MRGACHRAALLPSLGSQQGNAHVHWHVVPLLPDVPYEEQQLEAVSLEQGVFDLSERELDELAARIGACLNAA